MAGSVVIDGPGLVVEDPGVGSEVVEGTGASVMLVGGLFVAPPVVSSRTTLVVNRRLV